VGRWFYERAAGSYSTMLAREGITPARLRQLKETVVPPSRKITKTDLAKYLNAWAQNPDVVSLGSQKNFEAFMERLTERERLGESVMPDLSRFKTMIAQAILFKKVHSTVRPMFPAFQGNVAAYLVAVIANRLGDRMDLERVWARQDVSPQLRQQVQTWASEVNDVLHRTAAGRMVSEWAKKPECWEAVQAATYSTPIRDIPEIR
jgi:hypothetical protein